MTKKGKKIATISDPFGNIVHTTSKTWKHIETGHPDMAGRLDDVQAAISQADRVRPSTKEFETDTAFALEKSFSTTDEIRVLVAYGTANLFDGTAEGYVSTAYPPSPAYSSAVGDVMWETGTGTTAADMP